MRPKGRTRRSTISTSSSCTKNYKKLRSRIRSVRFPVSSRPSRSIRICSSGPSKSTLPSREWTGRMKVSSTNPNNRIISWSRSAFRLNCILFMFRRTKTTVVITKGTNSTVKSTVQGFLYSPTMDFMRVNSTMIWCRVKESFITMKKTSLTKVVICLTRIGQFLSGNFHGHGVLYNHSP